MAITHFVVHSLTDGYVSCFHFKKKKNVIINEATMNICAQVSV